VYYAVKYWIRSVVKSVFFEHFMTICVTVNTIILAIDRYGISQTEENNLQNFNLFFTIVFTVEMALKLFGLGFKSKFYKFCNYLVLGYLSDTMNYLDGSVVFISLIELIFLGKGSSNFSAFRTVRIFRFRV
jgi:hypothetical protein